MGLISSEGSIEERSITDSPKEERVEIFICFKEEQRSSFEKFKNLGRSNPKK